MSIFCRTLLVEHDLCPMMVILCHACSRTTVDLFSVDPVESAMCLQAGQCCDQRGDQVVPGEQAHLPGGGCSGNRLVWATSGPSNRPSKGSTEWVGACERSQPSFCTDLALLLSIQGSARVGSPTGSCSRARTSASRRNEPSSAGTSWRRPTLVTLTP